MPIKSEQQRRFMAMCLHSPEKAKGKCPPKSVAKKFIHGHKKQEENNMEITYRHGLRALFEASLRSQIQSGKLEEYSFFGTLLGNAARRAKRGAMGIKAGYQQLAGDTEGAQRTFRKSGAIKTSGERHTAMINRFKAARAARADKQAAATAAPTQADTPAQQAAATSNKDKLLSKLIAYRASKSGNATKLPAQTTFNPSQEEESVHDSKQYRLGLKALFEAVLMERRQLGLSPEEDKSLAGPKGTPASDVARAGAHLQTMTDKPVETMTPTELSRAQTAVDLRMDATRKAGGGRLSPDSIRVLFAKLGNTGGDRRHRGVPKNKP